jgi:iron complex outermembrane receptor protein
VTPFARWTSAIHYPRGKGFFEQYKANQNLLEYGSDVVENSDLIRQLWLDNDFYGFISSLRIGRPEARYFIIGGGWNTYLGDHFGKVIGPDEVLDLVADPYYFNQATKKDGNLYARSNMKISSKVDATIDLQVRWIRYDFEGPDEEGLPQMQSVRHRFFNPKLGVRYILSDHHAFYALTGWNHKEPNRDDNINSTPLSRPSAETLWDNEIGYRLSNDRLRLEFTGYAMLYDDQLVPTGRLNDVGAYTRVNVDNSYRLGLEWSADMQATRRFEIGIQATLSQNKIKTFDEYIDDWDTGTQIRITHEDTDIAFSPNVMGSLNAGYALFNDDRQVLKFTLSNRYIGKQYVDNTSRKASALDAYFVSDAGLLWTIFPKWSKEIQVGVMCYNVWDERYESNGWIYRFQSAGYDPRPDDPYAGLESASVYHLKGYFPQAGRHFQIQLNARF